MKDSVAKHDKKKTHGFYIIIAEKSLNKQKKQWIVQKQILRKEMNLIPRVAT